MALQLASCTASEFDHDFGKRDHDTMPFGPRTQVLRRRFTERAMRLAFRSAVPPTPAAGTLPLDGIHRILVCRFVRTLGNSLMLTPLLQEIHATWPGAEIDLVSRSPVATEIYGSFFGIGRIIRLPTHAPRHPILTLRALMQMRKTYYDLAIDPDPQSQSGRLLAILARKRLSLGYGGTHKSGSMTHAVPTDCAPRHQAMEPVFLLRRALGEPPAGRAYPRLDIRLSPLERRHGGKVLARLLANAPTGHSGCIGVFGNATGDKRFDGGWWNRFLHELEPGVSGHPLVEILAATGNSYLDSRYPCFYSGNVRKLASVLANLALFITADCGVMHLASAAGVPTIGIFKVTDPTQWGPYGGSNLAIDARGLSPEQVAERVLEACHAALAATVACKHPGAAAVRRTTSSTTR